MRYPSISQISHPELIRCLSGSELNRFRELSVGALILSSKGKRHLLFSWLNWCSGWNFIFVVTSLSKMHLFCSKLPWIPQLLPRPLSECCYYFPFDHQSSSPSFCHHGKAFDHQSSSPSFCHHGKVVTKSGQKMYSSM